MKYVFDTYALIEWLVKENENYRKYFVQMENSEGFVTTFTLVELYHKVYHTLGQGRVDEIFAIVTGNLNVTKVTPEIIKKSGIFRSQMLKKKLEVSYTDSVNYATATFLGVKLLTGDEDFRNVDNVEFVK